MSKALYHLWASMPSKKTGLDGSPQREALARGDLIGIILLESETALYPKQVMCVFARGDVVRLCWRFWGLIIGGPEMFFLVGDGFFSRLVRYFEGASLAYEIVTFCCIVSVGGSFETPLSRKKHFIFITDFWL